MSNVLLRNRSVSELEFWKNGADIRAVVTLATGSHFSGH